MILVADEMEQSLRMRKYHYKGEDGKNGSSKQMHGRNGRDQIIRVPCGVVVKRVIPTWETFSEEGAVELATVAGGGEYDDDEDDDDDDESSSMVVSGSSSGSDGGGGEDDDWDVHPCENVLHDNSTETIQPPHVQELSLDKNASTVDDDDDLEDDHFLISSSDEMYTSTQDDIHKTTTILADLDQPGSYIIVAHGGRGGIGNCAYAKRQHIPDVLARAHEKSRGEPGEVIHLELELKLIADVGLVGFPNAGKSSLLAAMSKAQPKIAPYPFTTIHPWVGAVEYRDGFRALVADVPGLIGGASQGRGRGFDFLRHLERTKALLYLLDAAGVDGRDPLTDLRTLVEEIRSYGNGDMLQRPALVVANKMDLIQDDKVQDEILRAISVTGQECGIRFNGEVHGISAGVSGEGLGGLSMAIRSMVEGNGWFQSEDVSTTRVS